jgi:hypothetical protein
MAHPETLLPMPHINDPVQRFVSVVRFYLSGWHIKPPYVLYLILLPLYPKVLMYFQRGQETTQSDLGREVHVLLGIP